MDMEEILEEKSEASEKSETSIQPKKDDKKYYDFCSDNDFIRYLQFCYTCFFRSIKAISACILLTVIVVKFSYDASETIFTTTFDSFWNENSFVHILSICIPALLVHFTIPIFLHFLLLYYRWDTIFAVMMNGSFFYLIYVSSGILLSKVSDIHELPLDNIALGFIVWNFTILAVLSVRWKGPAGLKKAFLTIWPALASALFINFFSLKLLWMIIIAVSFWDIFDVLHHHGPLNLINKVLIDRDIPIPAGMAYPLDDDSDYDNMGDDGEDIKFETAEEQLNKQGPAIGLGNWLITFICYFALLIGMFIGDTVIMAGNYHIFPALPFPIFCGMAAYYVSKGFMAVYSPEFMDLLNDT